MDKDQQPFDLFISHSSKDSLVASAIKQNLQNKGIRCWKAPDDILPGESWPSAIMRALSRCRAMVLVWTGNSMTSVEVSKELTLAMRHNLIVIPFRIDNTEPVGDWEYHLANTHWMDATDGLAEKHYNILGDFLLKVLPARETIAIPVENQMSLKDLEQLIEQALEDGVLTEQERILLLRDAVALGRNRDEFNAELDARLVVRKKDMAARVPNVSPNVAPPAPKPSTAPLSPPRPPAVEPTAYTKEQKDKKLISGILAILLGWLGVHKFYLGYKVEGVIMLVVSLLGSFLCLPSIVICIVAIIEGIIYLSKSSDAFVATYVVGRKGWF